jgi:hypothetical protein
MDEESSQSLVPQKSPRCKMFSMQRTRKAGTIVSDAEAYIDILGQKLVRRFVLLQDVTVDTSAGEGAA